MLAQSAHKEECFFDPQNLRRSSHLLFSYALVELSSASSAVKYLLFLRLRDDVTAVSGRAVSSVIHFSGPADAFPELGEEFALGAVL